MDIRIGQLINAPFLAAPAEVKRFEPRRGYYLLEVVLQDGNHSFKTLRITPDQLAQVQIAGQDTLTVTSNAEDFFFLMEAHRVRLAYQFDPQLAVSVSQVDPLPHQIEAVYHYVLTSPRIRFLIADDPGAGKTIMGGLILKELQYRRLARRVLIVAPGHLKYQWQREMKERFGVSFSIIDRAVMNSAWGENIWDDRDLCITSIDFVKQDSVRATLQSSRWDLVIVDEAHKMSAHAYPGRERVRVNKTKRYQVGEILSAQTEHMLFLTATPHRGDEEGFRLFLDLLRPGFFAQTELLRESVENKDNPIFLRRLKEDMRTFDGHPIFPPRHVNTAPFRLTDGERDLYNEVTRYVQDYYDKAKENRSISFALVILQRRLTSSSYAIYRSLVRRKARLEELLDLPERIRQDAEDYLRVQNLSEEELEDMAEADREKIEQRLEHLTIAKNIDDVKAELVELDRLIERAEQVREQESESKLIALRDGVLRNLGQRKLLIFTEFRDTLDYLAGDGQSGRPLGKLREWGYDVVTIHGQMGMDARIEAEHEFRDRAQIMVATEAAGEGINLQFCSLMVNYDIPWNPNRLEQRMGRIHRYGQQYEVFVWNLITRDTREGQILDRIFEKLDSMREALGSDRVFDIIGQVIPGARLDELLRDAIFNQRRMEEIEQVIDRVDARTVRQTLERVFLTSLATRHIDYSGVLQETLESNENRLAPEYIQDYFLRAFQRLGGRYERRDDTVTIPSVPYELRRWGNDYAFKTTYGKLFREYRCVTFDKRYAREHPEATFVAPGHPLLEAINEQVLTTFNRSDGAYAVFGDPDGVRQGVFWFVEGEVTDGAGAPAGKRVFCLYQTADGVVQQVNPAILWDHEPLSHPDQEERYQGWDGDIPADVAELLQQREDIEDYIIIDILMPFRDEIAARREREAQIKEKYGLRSLGILIQESNQKILDYQFRQDMGDAVELPLLNEQRNLEQLEQRQLELRREIELERNLTVGEPRILGAAVVIPLVEAEPTEDAGERTPHMTRERPDVPYITGGRDDKGAGMQRDDEVEAVGMVVAMDYEREQGWQVEDVSEQNHGFDLRSVRYNEEGILIDVRYIEVKARARSGAIRLSANEWKKARRFGERYWLYIVTSAGTNAPRLHRIQDPAARFLEDEDIFATGFIIPETVWQEKSAERVVDYSTQELAS